MEDAASSSSVAPHLHLVHRQTVRRSSGSHPCSMRGSLRESRRDTPGSRSRATTSGPWNIEPKWPEWVLRQDFACVWVRAPNVAAAVEMAAKRLGHMGGWKVGPDVEQEVFRGEKYREHARPGDYTRSGDPRLAFVVGDGEPNVQEHEGHEAGTWVRHIATLPAVVAGAWYGVETGSRGAFVVAGVAAIAWIVWPETARFIAWRRRRHAERAIERAERQLARAERAKRRAERRPRHQRLARRANHLEKRAEQALARAVRGKEQVQGLDGTWGKGPASREH